MNVDNAGEGVLVRMPTDALRRAPDIALLQSNFRRWLSVNQNQGKPLVERGKSSRREARLRSVVEWVPRG